MCVDVFWILTSDAGSTPATSTRLRFEQGSNGDCRGVVPTCRNGAGLFTVPLLKTTPR